MVDPVAAAALASVRALTDLPTGDPLAGVDLDNGVPRQEEAPPPKVRTQVVVEAVAEEMPTVADEIRETEPDSSQESSAFGMSTLEVPLPVAREELFEDEAAARAFHLLPDPALLSTPALSADGAQEMAAGERTRVEVGARGSLGVSGEGTGGPSVSLGAQGGGAAGLEVERLDDRWFAVTRDLSADASAYGGLGRRAST